ncbi:MAG TPA: DUF883 C-terminal domain-containing protein [Planctomycetota bacterium]|nr:DUF883 C-terminal domain-containing protein [Planctomycetota bacterium]
MGTYENMQGNSGESILSGRNSRTLGEQSHRVMDEVKELGSSALASASEAANQLRERGASAYETGKQKAVEAKGQFEEIVGDNPVKSVLIALGIGAAIGYALRRR